jgi:hypothetical protein
MKMTPMEGKTKVNAKAATVIIAIGTLLLGGTLIRALFFAPAAPQPTEELAAVTDNQQGDAFLRQLQAERAAKPVVASPAPKPNPVDEAALQAEAEAMRKLGLPMTVTTTSKTLPPGLPLQGPRPVTRASAEIDNQLSALRKQLADMQAPQKSIP